MLKRGALLALAVELPAVGAVEVAALSFVLFVVLSRRSSNRLLPEGSFFFCAAAEVRSMVVLLITFVVGAWLPVFPVPLLLLLVAETCELDALD